MGLVTRTLNRWEHFRPTKTHAFWITAAAIAGTLVIGFGPGGWTTGATAEKMAADAALSARHELGAAVCVEHFMTAANVQARLQKLRNAAYYQRSDLVAEGGWATMPGKSEPNFSVARMCAERLGEMKAPPV